MSKPITFADFHIMTLPAVSLMHPGWRVNLERELALCSDVPVSLLPQQGDITDAAYLMSIVRRINGGAAGSTPPQSKAQGKCILTHQ